MTRKLTVAVLSGLVIICLAALTLWGIARFSAPGSEAPTAPAATEELITEPGEAVLYFPGRFGRLYPERRSLASELTGEERLRLVIQELLAGPGSDELVAALPPHVELADVTLDADGTLYVDLGSKEGTLRGMGSTSELLAVYSLVDTALANEPQAQRVVILWNGRQQSSLAGHVDTTRPLTLDRRLIAESS